MTIKKGLDGKYYLVTKNPYNDSNVETCIIHTEKSYEDMIEYCKSCFAESYRKGNIRLKVGA